MLLNNGADRTESQGASALLRSLNLPQHTGECFKLIKMSGLHQCFCGCDDNEDAGFSVAVSARVYILLFGAIRSKVKSSSASSLSQPGSIKQRSPAELCLSSPLGGALHPDTEPSLSAAAGELKLVSTRIV